jgi:hypothetical protein
MLYVATNGNGDKIAALVLRRTHADGDWALSQSALDYVAGALRDGRITEGYVVLANKWSVVAHASAKEVLASIGDTEPNDGQWGPYFWLNTALKPVADYRAVVDDDKPW